MGFAAAVKDGWDRALNDPMTIARMHPAVAR